MNNFFKILKTSKILIPVFIISLALSAFLSYYIPVVMENGLVKNIVKHSKEDVERLQMVREYYTKVIVGDVKKYAPKLSFDYTHDGVDAKLPFPTTVIHDLSDMYSSRSDIKFELYSNHPFLNRKDRVLSSFQKKSLEMVEKSEDGLYYKRDIINGKNVLRVVVADYMVIPACVTCHNTHKLKDWGSDRWKLGDKRGVLEIITPIDNELEEMYISRNKIVFATLVLMSILFIYYSYILLRREKELSDENEILSEDYQDILKDFDKHVIASKTDLDGHITYASKRFCEISGYTRDELIGKTHNIIMNEDMDRKIFIEMWEDVENNKIWRGEIKNKTKEGDYYWVDAIISPIYNHNSKKIGYSAIRHDITDKKKIQQDIEINKQKDQHLFEQSRMAQMGEMLSMIAHQWRQPLSAICAASTALELKANLNKLDKTQTIEIAKKISNFSQHLSITINDFREFYKINKKKEQISFDYLMISTLGIVEMSIENKDIKIIKEVNSENLFSSYSNELKQVILNLLKNAEDVLIEKDIKNPYIKIAIYTKENKEILEISDNGGGVPEEIMDKIFNPYFSTKLDKNGTGLGLYMSKVIVEEHCNGKLSVVNGKDGATFAIEL